MFRQGRPPNKRLPGVTTGIGVLILLLVAGCESAGNDTQTSPRTPGFLSTMTEGDFHAIGVAAGAPAIASGTALAPAMHADEASLQTYISTACGGTKPILLPSLTAFPSEVPAYEALFENLAAQCELTTTQLDRLRGGVAASIASNQELLGKLPSGSSTSQFCTQLDEAGPLTSFVISAAAAKLHLDETESKILEIGVELMVNGCPELLTRVTSG